MTEPRSHCRDFFGETQRIRIRGKITKDAVVRCSSFWFGKKKCSLSQRSPTLVEVLQMFEMFTSVLVPRRVTTIFTHAQWGILNLCYSILVRCNSLNLILHRCWNRRFSLWFCLQFCVKQDNFISVVIHWNIHEHTLKCSLYFQYFSF